MNQTSRLNLRALRAFAEVYRWRKLNAAAERLHLTPSAVSVLVRQLEESVGTRLFDRTTRALSPTAAATQMLPLVERILRDVQSVESDFRTPDVVKGRIAIAVTPTVALTLMPPLMRRFEELHPQIHVSLIDGEASQFVPRILADEVDFGVGSPGQSLGDLTQRTLIQDHLCVACLATHPLAQRKTVRWADLRHHKLVTVKAGYGIRGAIDEAARKAGVRLDFHHEVSMLTTALAMTASGLGVAIVSGELVALTGFSALTVRKIERPVVVRNISIVTRRKRTLSMAAELFISHMQAQLAQSRG
jgi:DNA-binding transcriptional LysR family regulator